jgi:hypothetical protein
VFDAEDFYSMNRFLAASTLGLMSLLTLNAGQIQIGGASGVTTGYFLGTTTPTCTGGAISYNPGFTSCLSTASYASTQGSPAAQNTSASNLYGVGTSNTTGWSLKTDSVMFQSAAAGPAVGPITSSSGTVFNLANNGSGSSAIYADYGLNNGAVTPGTYYLTTPVGIADVSSVSTLLQDFWGSSAATGVGDGATGQSTAVTFEFSTASNGSVSPTFVTAYLTNGDDIRDQLSCSAGCTSSLTSLSNDQTGYLATDTLETATGNSLAASLSATPTTVNGISEVFTPDVYSAAFSGATLATAGGYGNVTAGNVQLDEQTFSFGAPYASDFLVAVIVDNQMSPYVSKAALNGITVTQVTPEPSTILLLLTGLGSIGLGAFRRKK